MKPSPISAGREGERLKAHGSKVAHKLNTTGLPTFEQRNRLRKKKGRRTAHSVLQKKKVEHIFMAAAAAWTFLGAQKERERKQAGREDRSRGRT